jgi:hypothetical protein
MQLVIDEDYTETYLPGTLTTLNQNQTVLVTIPYDEGWQITVDGKPVEIYKTLDCLIAFDVEDAGEHEVVMKYRPKTFVYGMYVTVFCSVLFLGLCALVMWMNKKNKHFFLLNGVPVREFDDTVEEKKPSPEDLADFEAANKSADESDESIK